MNKIFNYKFQIVFTIITCFYPLVSSSQNTRKGWEIEVTNGIQLSGRKPEDFTKRNFTYYNNISIEKVITKNYCLHGGIMGYSFSTIEDFSRQKYLYVNAGLSYKIGHRIWIKAGSGILNNSTYDNASVCLNYSILINILETKHIDFYLMKGAIVGFRIYQNPPLDKDILPNLGLTFSIKL